MSDAHVTCVRTRLRTRALHGLTLRCWLSPSKPTFKTEPSTACRILRFETGIFPAPDSPAATAPKS
jgi:hypothetical protein